MFVWLRHASVSTFAPVLLIGITLACVLFLTPHRSPEPQEEPVNELVMLGDEEAIHRINIKNAIVEDLLSGVTTWAEALERFEEISLSSATGRNNLQLFQADGSMHEIAAHQLWTFVQLRVVEQPRKYQAVLSVIYESAKADIGG